MPLKMLLRSRVKFLVEELGKEKLIDAQIAGSNLTIRSLLPADQTWEEETVELFLPNKLIHWFKLDRQEQSFHERDRI